jgi:hypothetical protein
MPQSRFQWASLQIDQLLDLPPLERVIRDRLGKLPKDLEKAYDEIYARIQAQDKRVIEIADRAFQWVMCSCAPLSTAELIAAVCQDPDTDTVNPADDMDINENHNSSSDICAALNRLNCLSCFYDILSGT